MAAMEPRVREAVDSVSGLIERRGGPALAPRVATHTPMVVPDSTRAMFGMLRVIAFVPDTGRRSASIARRPIPATATASQIADGLASMVEQFALQGADSALAAWVMLGRVPLRPASAAEAADMYFELATIASAALRRCRTEDSASCLDVLGVDSLPGTRLARWYAPDDYRRLLAIVAPPREDSVAVAAWLQCRENRDETACVAAANAIPDSRIPPPLSATARVMFLREVLEAGGPAAYGRLMSASGSVRGRLEYASGQPLDTIVRRWRARIEHARPDRMRLQPGLVLASLGWTGLLLGLTLARRGTWALTIWRWCAGVTLGCAGVAVALLPFPHGVQHTWVPSPPASLASEIGRFTREAAVARNAVREYRSAVGLERWRLAIAGTDTAAIRIDKTVPAAVAIRGSCHRRGAMECARRRVRGERRSLHLRGFDDDSSRQHGSGHPSADRAPRPR